MLLVAILAFYSLLMVKQSEAQTIPKPSVPEFTLNYIDYSYDVPPTYKINEYTGETVAIGGYHIKNMTIQVSIKNNPIQSNDATSHLYYNVRFKGHFGKEWSETPSVIVKNSSPSTFSQYVNISPYNFRLLKQSSYEYTTFLFSVNDYIPNSSIDFQVEAVLGHDSQAWITADPYGKSPAHYYEAVAFDETSGWSPTQTITIQATSTVTPTQTDSLPNMGSSSPPNTNSELTIALTWVIIGILVISVISLLLYVKHLKRSISSSYSH